MSATCESLHGVIHQREFTSTRSYTILSIGERPNSIENYLLIPVEGAGFVVIKQEIEIDD